MALKGVRVLEFVGLAPAPFCGMLLSDFGATVTRVDKIPVNPLDCLTAGKRTIAINTKHAEGKELVKLMCKHTDVLIDPFRPGVMEKMDIGPNVLCELNPKLIYARLTGFGQTGPLAHRAGHDINYVALSGILSFLGRKWEKPTPPCNLLADFAGGGLLCAFGILAALLHRHNTGCGQIVDASMTEGAAYVSSWLMRSQSSLPIWGNARGDNMLDTGRFFYDTYETKDGKYMSVGCLEEKFFEIFTEKLGLSGNKEFNQFMDNDKGKEVVTNCFKARTQTEWSAIFEDSDACVYPVVDWQDAAMHRHNVARQSFTQTKDGLIPNPAPRLSATPTQSAGALNEKPKDLGLEMQQILFEVGLRVDQINKLIEDGVVIPPNKKQKL